MRNIDNTWNGPSPIHKFSVCGDKYLHWYLESVIKQANHHINYADLQKFMGFLASGNPELFDKSNSEQFSRNCPQNWELLIKNGKLTDHWGFRKKISDTLYCALVKKNIFCSAYPLLWHMTVFLSYRIYRP